jgi:hypothetical protein
VKSAGRCPPCRGWPMPCRQLPCKNPKAPLQSLRTRASNWRRDYNVTTTPGPSTRSPISSENIRAAHGQFRSMPKSREIDEL